MLFTIVGVGGAIIGGFIFSYFYSKRLARKMNERRHYDANIKTHSSKLGSASEAEPGQDNP